MRMHGMAVPILDQHRVAGCVSMRFPRSAMSETEAGARYGEPLAKMTAAIAADLANRRDVAGGGGPGL
jgi:IclR family mhp operon transcriptional activator